MLYLKGTRAMMFQLSGFYFRVPRGSLQLSGCHGATCPRESFLPAGYNARAVVCNSSGCLSNCAVDAAGPPLGVLTLQ